jgi:hypothetical protein
MSTTYYINGTTFSNATAVFTDAELTTCAPDGYYRLGNVTRQQLNCQLLKEEDCEICGLVDCNNEVSLPATTDTGKKIYHTFFDMGANLGAVIVVIDLALNASSFDTPTGVRVVYGSNTYNRFVRKVGGSSLGNGGTANANSVGLAESTVADDYTVLGGGDTCLTTGYSSYGYYRYDGTSYELQSLPIGETLEAGNIAQNQIGPGQNSIDYAVLVFPKTSATSNTFFVDVLQFCEQKGFDIHVHCPMVLTGFLSSNLPSPDLATACAATTNNTLYAVGSGQGIDLDTSLTTPNPTLPQVRDLIFTDSNGTTRPTDGWYKVDTGNPSTDYSINVIDGIVSAANSCTA